MFGIRLEVPPSVFHPNLFYTTRIFGEYLMRLDFKGLRVLDVGSGSGVLSLLAARGGADVVSVDINPLAVEASRHNAERNGLGGKMITMESDLFASVKAEQFDLIITNPPYYRRPVNTPIEAAFNGGEQLEFFQELAHSAPRFLKRNGKLVMILSSDADIEAILKLFRGQGFTLQEVWKKRKLFEKLVIYELRVSGVR